MTLIWRENEARAYAGSAEYLFSGRLLGTPAFSFSAENVHCGEIVILSAYNISDPSAISVECTPEFDCDPKFYKVGESYQALIAIPAELTDTLTSYTFTLSSSTAKDKLTLNVAPLQRSSYDFYAPDAQDYYNESVLNALWASIRPILEAPSEQSFAGGKFQIPAQDNYISDTSNYRFGATVNIINIKKSYLAWDNMYCAQMKKVNDVCVEGDVTKVLSAYAGKVVYVGAQTFTGRLVIIDHGSGLKTWYTNLSSDIAVHLGDEVSSGQFIAHAADGGFNAQLNFNFHVGAFVNGVPVSLQQLIEHGLIAHQ
ncbi:MAG: M23 family metallopeptidase [Clostridia bacterium]|nr:M23 family metallopeptidase [Clostridia bacterium]